MLLKDPHKFLSLNQDDTPAKLSPEEVTDAFNLRMGSSSEDQQSGQAETLQAEISVPISPDASIVYYGQPIGGQFLYSGYAEVQIGTQVWMAKNWDAQYPGSKVYGDDEDNRTIYGGLYTHDQAILPDFCPLGWHLPTEADINTLLTYLGGLLVGGGHLKEVGESHWNDPNLGADDSFGFRALPGGKFDMLYDLLGSKCLLWLLDDGAPLAPIAFPAVNITYNSFKANWSQSDGADGYDIDVSYYGGPIGWEYLLQDFNVGNVLNYILSNLLPDTDYSYLVRAYNDIGTSGNSNTIVLKTLLATPVAKTASVIFDTGFTANWNAVSGAIGYLLDVATDSGFSTMVPGYSNLDVGNVTSKAIIGLTVHKTYYYRVRAYKPNNTSASSNIISAYTVFGDWFLPSKNELKAMYDELRAYGVGGLGNNTYWSSSELSNISAWFHNFGSNSQSQNTKDYLLFVRACRTFSAAIGAYALRDIGPAGGWVFWTDGAGNYLEAAPTNQSISQAWSNIINVAIGTTGTAIGTGQANTTAIIGQAGHIDSAAKLCDDLVV